MEVKERNKLVMSGRGILTATKKGTRKYDEKGNLIDSGEIVEVVESPNIICNEGLVLVAGFTIDESVTYDTGITYCEIGTGDTSPAAGDTTLTTYHGRKAVTSKSRASYELTIATFFTAAESTANIKEAGMWGGGDAAAGEATGLLFSHFLVSFDNSGGSYDVTISYVLTVSRG
jgi:hypothetical protein